MVVTVAAVLIALGGGITIAIRVSFVADTIFRLFIIHLLMPNLQGLPPSSDHPSINVETQRNDALSFVMPHFSHDFVWSYPHEPYSPVSNADCDHLSTE